jgi:hypothetical protein
MGWLIALGILTLLAVLPLGVSIRYDSEGAVVKLIAGPVGITLFPRPKKDKKPKKEKTTVEPEKNENQPETESVPQPGSQETPAQQPQPEQTPAQPPEAEKTKKRSGGPITDFLPLLRIVPDMLGAFRRKLRLNMLELKLIMAADDPCDLAVNYGRAWAAVGNLMPRLERVFVIKKRNVKIQCDFEASQTLVTACLEVTITLGRLLALVVIYGLRGIKEFMKLQKLRKGGTIK